MVKRESVYLVDACLPNEGEADLALEFGILRWGSDRERPGVYVHSYVRPKYPARVRWANASEMGVTRDLIDTRGGLPSMAELIERNFLKGRRVVCFDRTAEPFASLTAQASHVESIIDLWQEVYAENPEALSCMRLGAMLNFMGLPSYDRNERHYTPLLQRLHAMAALWYLLDHFREDPDKARGGLPFTPVWPLEPVPESWFSVEPQQLSDIPKPDLEEFFVRRLPDYLDWRGITIYGHDWVFSRRSIPEQKDLDKRLDMAEFIFSRVFELNMQLWVLIFYSLYERHADYAVAVASANGSFGLLPPAAAEDFSAFLLSHLEDFLTVTQKLQFIRAIIHQSMQERDREPFQPFDFMALRKEKDNGSGSKNLVFRTEPVLRNRANCYYEISDSNHQPVYIRYEISGRGSERRACSEGVDNMLHALMQEIKEPFSRYWTTPEVRTWIKFITGISWNEFKTPRYNEGSYITEGRHALANAIREESMPYVRRLHDFLLEAVNAIHADDGGELTRKTAFQGISIEITVTKKPQVPLIKRLLNLS